MNTPMNAVLPESPAGFAGRAARWSDPSGVRRPALSEESVAAYLDKGYLVVRDALLPEEVFELNGEALRICRGDLGEARGLEKAGAQDSEAEVLSRYVCIHFPHKLSATIHRHLAHPVVVDVLTRVIGPDVKCMQSMLFIKAAGKPGQAWRQDEYYIPTRDRSLTGVWIALDDATVENGRLWVIPGSHRHGIIWPQHEHRDPRFDCAGEAVEFPYTDADAVPVEVPRGAAVFFNGYLLHRSLPNSAKAGYRRALANHYMSAASLLPWPLPKEFVHMGNHDYRDVVLVAGRDPYRWKGYEEVAVPHVRREGRGGCGDPKDNAK